MHVIELQAAAAPASKGIGTSTMVRNSQSQRVGSRHWTALEKVIDGRRAAPRVVRKYRAVSRRTRRIKRRILPQQLHQGIVRVVG